MNARDRALSAPLRDIEDRVEAVDWRQVGAELDARGAATIEGLITPAECEALASLHALDALFRSTVVMARHGFGRGSVVRVRRSETQRPTHARAADAW